MSSASETRSCNREVAGATTATEATAADQAQPQRCDIDVVLTTAMSHRGGSEPGAGAGSAGTKSSKLRWVAFGAVITAAVMDLLDSTIAQVAAPTIRRELGGSYAVIEWVTAAYALAMAVGLLTGGRLGDIFGRRRWRWAGGRCPRA